MKNALRTFVARCAVASLASLGNAAAFAQDEPHVQATDPLTPEQQLTRFHLPEGFTIELVAADPLIAKPINIAFDARGRLLVTQTTDYPYAQIDKPGDALLILEDRDADGSFESVAGKVEGLTIPIGLAPVGDDIVVYGIPNIYRASDADGDGVYETKKTLFGPLGYVDTHGMQNGFVRWYDGWIYACHGFRNDSKFVATDGSEIELNSGNTYRFRPDGSRVEVVTRGQVNPFGTAFDAWGNQYTADCHSQPLYQLIPGAYYPSFGKPHDGLGYGPEIVRHSHGSTGIAGVAFYDDDRFPEEYRGDAFIGNPITHRVNRDEIVRDGASFRGDELPDFLTCDDPWFRPVDVKLGPDGCLYVADFYNRIIGHYEVPLDHPQRDKTSGRIWRISYGTPQDRQPVSLAGMSMEQLWKELNSPNATRRLAATHELVDRFGDEAGKFVKERAGFASENQLIATIWILHRTTGLEGSFDGGADAVSPLVRAHAVTAARDRSPEAWDAQPGFAKFVIERLADEEPMVRRLAAQALAYHPKSEYIAPLVACYRQAGGNDVYLKHALKIAIRNSTQATGGFEAAGALFAGDAANDRELRSLLVDVAIGTDGEGAAKFLLANAPANLIGDGQIGAAGEKIGRWLPAGHDADIEAWLAGFESHAPQHWPGALQAVARGAQMRGQPLPAAVSTYGKQVCEAQLAADSPVSANLLDAAILADWKLSPEVVGPLYVTTAKPDLRERACVLFARSDAPAFVESAATVLLDSAQPSALRKRTAVALSSVDGPAASDLLSKGLAAMPYGLAYETVRDMGFSADRVKFLVSAILGGRLSENLLREKDVQEGIRQAGVAEAVAFLDERLPKLPALDQELDARIATLAGRATEAPAPTAQGALLYEQKCAKCHQLAGKGEKIGPQLDGVGHRGALRLLEDILDPNRNVDPAFRSTTFLLSDGRTLTGLVVKEEGQTITLADPEGKLSPVAAGDVEQRRASTLSPMPANWRELLKDDELVELTRFLAAQRPEAK